MSVSQTTGMDSSDTTTRGADDESIAWDADNLASGFVAEVEINDLAAGFEINSTSSVPSDHSVQSATSPPCVDNPSDLSDGVMIMTDMSAASCQNPSSNEQSLVAAGQTVELSTTSEVTDNGSTAAAGPPGERNRPSMSEEDMIRVQQLITPRKEKLEKALRERYTYLALKLMLKDRQTQLESGVVPDDAKKIYSQANQDSVSCVEQTASSSASLLISANPSSIKPSAEGMRDTTPETGSNIECHAPNQAVSLSKGNTKSVSLPQQDRAVMSPAQSKFLSEQIKAYTQIRDGKSISDDEIERLRPKLAVLPPKLPPRIIVHLDSAIESMRSLGDSLYPPHKFVPISDAVVNKQRNSIIEARMLLRQRKLGNLNPEYAIDSSPTGIELRGLQLFKKQRQMLCDLLLEPETSGRIALASMRKDNIAEAKRIVKLQRKVDEEIQKMNRKKELDWFRGHLEHRKEILDLREHRRKMAKKLAHDAQKEVEKKIKREELKALLEEKHRMDLLRLNDEDGYRKLINETKNSRIQSLLDQTDKYLASMESKIRQAQANASSTEYDAVVTDEETPKCTEGLSNDADGMAVEEASEAHTKKYGKSHVISERVIKQAKIMVGGTLKEYQTRGLEWLVSLYNNKLNGILADEMGLGKTIQSISLLTYLVEKRHVNGPFLVIVPLTTMSNWMIEFDKWAPSLKVVAYKGPPQKRKQMHEQIRKLDFIIVLTTYEFCMRDKHILAKVDWRYMIIDEGHRLKNKDGKLIKTLASSYSAPRRLLLSGTPLQNNLPELWVLLNFLLPSIFKSSEDFEDWFSKPFSATGEKVELTAEENLLITRRLHKVLEPFLLRRLKTEVESQMPDKVEHILKCDMSALQKKLYRHMKTHNVLLSPAPVQATGTEKTTTKYLANKLIQLRKICNHPFIFQEIDAGMAEYLQKRDRRDARGYYMAKSVTGVDLWRSAGKFELLERMLPKLVSCGHRILVFCQMTEMMDVLEDYFRMCRYKYLRLDGSTGQESRSQLIEQFNAENSKYELFLLSTRAGGLGLNLQTADTVIIYDSDWNPHQDLQAMDRAHRIGQTKEVRVFRLVTVGSVEEEMLEAAHHKLDIDARVIQAGQYNSTATDDDRLEQLKQLLKDAEDDEDDQNDDDDEADDGESGEFTEHAYLSNQQLNALLARGDEFDVFERMDADADNAARSVSGWQNGLRQKRLMEVNELPDWLLKSDEDVAAEVTAKEKIDIYLGPRKTARDVSYAGISDKEFNRQLLVVNTEDTTRDETSSKTSAEYRRGKRKDGHGSSEGQNKRKRVTVSNKEQLWMIETLNDLCRMPESIPLIDLPDRTIYPDYYVVIPNPLSLSCIRTSIESGHCATLQKLTTMIELLVSNCFKYNEDGATICNDAKAVKTAFERAVHERKR